MKCKGSVDNMLEIFSQAADRNSAPNFTAPARLCSNTDGPVRSSEGTHAPHTLCNPLARSTALHKFFRTWNLRGLCLAYRPIRFNERVIEKPPFCNPLGGTQPLIERRCVCEHFAELGAIVHIPP